MEKANSLDEIEKLTTDVPCTNYRLLEFEHFIRTHPRLVDTKKRKKLRACYIADLAVACFKDLQKQQISSRVVEGCFDRISKRSSNLSKKCDRNLEDTETLKELQDYLQGSLDIPVRKKRKRVEAGLKSDDRFVAKKVKSNIAISPVYHFKMKIQKVIHACENPLKHLISPFSKNRCQVIIHNHIS